MKNRCKIAEKPMTNDAKRCKLKPSTKKTMRADETNQKTKENPMNINEGRKNMNAAAPPWHTFTRSGVTSDPSWVPKKVPGGSWDPFPEDSGAIFR